MCVMSCTNGNSDIIFLFSPYFIKTAYFTIWTIFRRTFFSFRFFFHSFWFGIRSNRTNIWSVSAHMRTYRFEFLNEYFEITFFSVCSNIQSTHMNIWKWDEREKKINLMNEIFAWHDIKHICNIYLNIWALPNGYCYCYCYFFSLIFEYRLSYNIFSVQQKSLLFLYLLRGCF